MEDENVAIAGLVLDELGARGVADAAGRAVGARLLDDGVRRAARLPGRLEVREVRGVRVVLDGAHVPSSLARVFADLAEREGLSPPATVAILGTGRDKDVHGLLKVLQGRTDRLICTSVGTGPAAQPEEIAGSASRLRLTAETVVTPRMAFQRALELCDGKGWVLVTGSLHLIGAVRTQLTDATPC
jgi:dihydrofolate synthase/folylpolyglutamate synthase